jgi:hypothetical protein
MGGEARRRQASGQPSRQSCAASGSSGWSSRKWGTDDLAWLADLLEEHGYELHLAHRSGPRGPPRRGSRQTPLIQMRSALKNRVHALIAWQGIQGAHAELFGAGGRASWTTSRCDQTPRPIERAAGLIADFDLLGTAQ